MTDLLAFFGPPFLTPTRFGTAALPAGSVREHEPLYVLAQPVEREHCARSHSVYRLQLAEPPGVPDAWPEMRVAQLTFLLERKLPVPPDEVLPEAVVLFLFHQLETC